MGITGAIRKLFYNKKEKRHHMVGPAHLWKMKQEFQLNFLKSQGLKSNHRLLDIGCGTLRGGIAMIDYLEESKYTGIEVRSAVLEEGKKELADEGLEWKKPSLQDFKIFNDLDFNEKFDVIFAFAVLFHMEDHIVDACFKFVSQNLDKNGVFYANVYPGDQKDRQWQGFPVAFRSIGFYENIALKYKLNITEIDTLYNLGHISDMPGDQQVMLKIRRNQ